MFNIQGHGLLEYFKLCGIAREVRKGKVPKGVTQETIFEALRITRPKNGFEMFGILKAAVHGPDGVLKRDLGVVSVKKVTAQFAKHIVDALCSSGSSDLLPMYVYHKMGTGSTAEASGDTALISFVPQPGASSGTSTHGASSQIYASTAVWTALTILNIREHGIFCASTGGSLLDRSVVATIDLITDDQVTWTYSLTVNTET